MFTTPSGSKDDKRTWYDVTDDKFLTFEQAIDAISENHHVFNMTEANQIREAVQKIISKD